MCVEAAKDFHPMRFHPMRFHVSFFLASKRVQRAKSPPLAFLTTLEASLKQDVCESL